MDGFCKGMVLLTPDTVYAPKGAKCSSSDPTINALWVPTDVAGSYLVKQLDGKHEKEQGGVYAMQCAFYT
jgi:hypothetical protein